MNDFKKLNNNIFWNYHLPEFSLDLRAPSMAIDDYTLDQESQFKRKLSEDTRAHMLKGYS